MSPIWCSENASGLKPPWIQKADEQVAMFSATFVAQAETRRSTAKAIFPAVQWRCRWLSPMPISVPPRRRFPRPFIPMSLAMT